MKKILLPFLIFCLALTACGGKTPARTIAATSTKTPTQTAQPDIRPATQTPTATTSPATSPPATTPAQTWYTLFFDMISASLPDAAKSGVRVQPGGTANLNYDPSINRNIYACSTESRALDNLVLHGTQAEPLRPIATGVPVDGQGKCSTFTDRFAGLAAWNGSRLNLDLGRVANPFEKMFGIVINYITPSSGGGSGSGGNDGEGNAGRVCPPGQVWYSEYNKCCDAIAGCTGE